MDFSHHLRSRNLLLIILFIGLLLRVFGVYYGFPQQLDPDERIFVHAAGKALGEQTLDPHWYGHPASTLIDLLLAAYAAIAITGLALGYLDSLPALETLWFDNTTVFYLAGRVITIITGMLCVVASYHLSRRFVSRPFALMAATIVSFSPMMVSYSSIIRADMLQILFILLVAIYSIKIIEAPAAYKRGFAFSGIFLGLAVTSKYPGIVAVIAILVATVLSQKLDIKQKFFGLAIAALLSLLAAFISGPYLFLNFHEMLNQVIFEARDYHLSQSNPGFLIAIQQYLKTALPLSTNFVIAILAYIGLITMLYSRGKQLVIASLFLAYLLFISSLNLYWTRWALPLIPLMAVGFAVTAEKIYQIVNGQQKVGHYKAAVSLVVVLIIAPTFLSSANHSWKKYQNNDTRVHSMEWIYQNIPPKSKILLETYTPQLPVKDYDVLIARDGKIIPWQEFKRYSRPDGYFGDFGNQLKSLNNSQLQKALKDSEVEYILMSSFMERFEREDQDNEAQLNVYRTMIGSSKKLQTFPSSNDKLGNSIHIHQL